MENREYRGEYEELSYLDQRIQRVAQRIWSILTGRRRTEAAAFEQRRTAQVLPGEPAGVSEVTHLGVFEHVARPDGSTAKYFVATQDLEDNWANFDSADRVQSYLGPVIWQAGYPERLPEPAPVFV